MAVKLIEMHEKRRTEDMRFGMQIEPGAVSDMVEQALLCEKWGFDSVWYPDHFIGGSPRSVWPEAVGAMTAIGLKTSRVVVGCGMTDVLRRHPALLAQSFATIDQFTEGRVALGIGAGEAMNLRPFGIPQTNSCERLREAIMVMRKLWCASYERPADFDGRFYRLKAAFLQVLPRSLPAIYLGAFGPRMLALTGELADGWMPFSHTPETYRETLYGPIKEAAERKGRSVSEIDPALLPAATISKDREEARKSILAIARNLLSLLPEVLNKCRPELRHPRAISLAGWMGRLDAGEMRVIQQVAQDIPEELALRTVIWGNRDDCIAQLENFIRSGCRHFVLGIRGKNRNQAIELFGKEVLPYFKEKYS